MIKVYGSPVSTCTRKVLLALEEKGAAYEFIPVDLATGAQKSPEHLARQPFGVVPAIDDDGFTLYESRAIIRYLDRSLSGAALSPTDAKGQARMDQFLSIEQSYFAGPTIQLFYQFRGGQPDAAVVAANREKLAQCADVVEKRLAESPYLAGEAFSLADIGFMPYVALLEMLGHGDIVSSRPAFAKWWANVSSRPTWKKISA